MFHGPEAYETAFKNTVTLDAITQIIDAFFGMHTPHTINCKLFSPDPEVLHWDAPANHF